MHRVRKLGLPLHFIDPQPIGLLSVQSDSPFQCFPLQLDWYTCHGLSYQGAITSTIASDRMSLLHHLSMTIARANPTHEVRLTCTNHIQSIANKVADHVNEIAHSDSIYTADSLSQWLVPHTPGIDPVNKP